MHPRIISLVNCVKEKLGLINEPNIEVLEILKIHGASSTEAIFVLALGFKLSLSDVEKFVYESKIWPPENPNDVFYQTLKYYYYDPYDKNYEVDGDDNITISI